jgi:hypothetical protein
LEINLNEPIPKEIVQLDSETCLIFLDVPGAKVVLFQGFFELYEGLGTVRTIDIRKSQIMVITTPSVLKECLMLLNTISDMISWRLIEKPADFVLER